MPDDNELLSDDELAMLERAMESGDPSGVEFHSRNRAEYRSAFEFIDNLAAPIRTAIETLNRPPVLEDYEELTEIARGGMGVVYRGLHKKTQRYDAVKVMRPDHLVGSASEHASLLRLQFLRESQLAARVAHEHIVPVYQVGETEGRPWFSMQLVEGSSLYDLTRNSQISPERVVRYIEQIARAIDTVHRYGILHGDIKPQNILIETKTDRPLISDFGLADFDSTSTMPSAMGIAGTPAYMAPELANAAISGKSDDTTAPRSVSTDIYSLGATLWAALTGNSPCYDNQTLQEQLADVANGDLKFNKKVDRKIDPALLSIIGKCVDSKPELRYLTVGELANELTQWLDRPRWNQHFATLRKLLCVVIAPMLLLSGLLVQTLLATKAAEFWILLVLFAGYGPLFASFLANQRSAHGAWQAHRELWSIWAGHLFVTISVLIALHVLCQSEVDRIYELFYPFWAAIACQVFFAKGGSFWAGYRWLGIAWSLIAIFLTLTDWAPLMFGVFAAITCFIIATMDRPLADA